MNPCEAKKKVKAMKFKKNSTYDAIKGLLLRDQLCAPIYSDELATKLRDATLRKVNISTIATYMKPFVTEEVVETVLVGKKRIWYCAWSTQKVEVSSYGFPFPEKLVNRLGREFEPDLGELRVVWGRCGSCMAFLCRKVIEKAIYIAFARQGMIDKLRDPQDSSRWIGLERMIDLASAERTSSGTPFLMPKTAERLENAKFLGDVAAHDFLVNVDPKQVGLEVNVISIALDELSETWQS
jgi:hypothetical protein